MHEGGWDQSPSLPRRLSRLLARVRRPTDQTGSAGGSPRTRPARATATAASVGPGLWSIQRDPCAVFHTSAPPLRRIASREGTRVRGLGAWPTYRSRLRSPGDPVDLTARKPGGFWRGMIPTRGRRVPRVVTGSWATPVRAWRPLFRGRQGTRQVHAWCPSLPIYLYALHNSVFGPLRSVVRLSRLWG